MCNVFILHGVKKLGTSESQLLFIKSSCLKQANKENPKPTSLAFFHCLEIQYSASVSNAICYLSQPMPCFGCCAIVSNILWQV